MSYFVDGNGNAKKVLSVIKKSEGLFKKLISGAETEIKAQDLVDITQIRAYAFYGYSNLTKITIGSNIEVIGAAALFGCVNLTSITILNTTPPTLGSSAFKNTNDCPIKVPPISVDTYKAAWEIYADRIEEI